MNWIQLMSLILLIFKKSKLHNYHFKKIFKKMHSLFIKYYPRSNNGIKGTNTGTKSFIFKEKLEQCLLSKLLNNKINIALDFHLL